MTEFLKADSLSIIKTFLKEEIPLHQFLTSRDPRCSMLGSLTTEELQRESDTLLGQGSLTEQEAKKISFGVITDHKQDAFKAYRLVMLRRILGNDNQEAGQNLCALFQSSSKKTDRRIDKKKTAGLSCLVKADPKEIKELFVLTGWPDKNGEYCKEPNCYPLDGLLVYLKGSSREQVLTALRKAVSNGLKASLEEIQN